MPKLPGMVGLLKTYFKLFESYNTEAFEYIIIVYWIFLQPDPTTFNGISKYVGEVRGNPHHYQKSEWTHIPITQ